LWAAAVLLVNISFAAASHFRYGTISWYPGSKARLENKFEAVFELQMVYRRDYNWGAYFKTQWRESPKLDWCAIFPAMTEGISASYSAFVLSRML